MKVKFLDNKGSEETIIFNPEILYFKDGTIIVFPTQAWMKGIQSELPLYAGEPKELWADIKMGIYDKTIKKLGPGAFKMAYINDGVLYIVRYKEKLDEVIIEKIKRIWNGFTQFWK